MTKAELLEAIQSTITSNGQKGITAESLANILVEMVNVVPEEKEEAGSGQVVFYLGAPDENKESFTLTQKQKAHNAKMYQVVRDSEVALNVSLDVSEIYQIMQEEDTGIIVEGIKYNLYSMGTGYIDEVAAAQLGSPYSGVSGICEIGPFFVLEDGSVVTIS